MAGCTGVAAALITTVAGLLVAIRRCSLQWLVHNLRVLTVELDNFRAGLVSKSKRNILKNDKSQDRC